MDNQQVGKKSIFLELKILCTVQKSKNFKIESKNEEARGEQHKITSKDRGNPGTNAGGTFAAS